MAVKRTHTPQTPNVVCSAVSRAGHGKTTFGLTAPKPLVISNDPNTEYAIDNLIAKGQLPDDFKDDRYHYIPLPPTAFNDDEDTLAELAEERWTKHIDALRPLVEDDNPLGIRSVVIDQATELDNLNTLCAFGKLDQIAPERRKHVLGRYNRRFKGLIENLRDARFNVLLLHRHNDIWETKEVRKRGGFEEERVRKEGPWDIERRGHKEVEFLASLEVILRHDPSRGGNLANQYGVKITRCGHRPTLIGEEYWGREKLEDGTRVSLATFGYVMMQIFPSTSWEDWQ